MSNTGLTAERANLPFQAPDSGLTGILAHHFEYGLVGQLQLAGPQPVFT